MERYGFPRLLFFILVLSLIFGCSYPISKELRQEARRDLTFPMVLQNPTAYKGSIVIWGGKIVKTMNHANGSDIIALEIPLGYEGRPKATEYSQGRFIAETSNFLDPVIYRKGRKITVAGEIIGQKTKPLGTTEYTYPVIRVKELHFWKKRRVYAYPYGWYGGWYGPYGLYFWPDDDWGDWDEGDEDDED